MRQHGEVSRAQDEKTLQEKQRVHLHEISIGIPGESHKKIELLKAKIFNDVDITTEETANEELVNIKLVRNKPAEENNKQNPEKTAPFILNPKEKKT